MYNYCFISVHSDPCAEHLTLYKVGDFFGLLLHFTPMSNRIPGPPFAPTQINKFHPGQQIHLYLRISWSVWERIGVVKPFLCLGIPRTL